MHFLKDLMPKDMKRIGKHLTGYGPHIRGNFKSWDNAKSASTGYTESNILELALQTSFDMRDGRLIRFPPYPIINALMRLAQKSQDTLRIIDFGGSFGSLYFQCSWWLPSLPLSWHIIEQPHYVQRAQNEKISNCLSFSSNFAGAPHTPDVIIFSGVLQYLENWQEVAEKALALAPRFIIVDRLPIISGKKDIICIQKTNHFYSIKSSYPMRLFARDTVADTFKSKYSILSESCSWDHAIGGIRRVEFKGFVFEKMLIYNDK